jgi:hypothetical protein
MDAWMKEKAQFAIQNDGFVCLSGVLPFLSFENSLAQFEVGVTACLIAGFSWHGASAVMTRLMTRAIEL